MTLQERLTEFIAKEGLTINKFETNCGFSNGYVRGIKDSIGSDKLVKIAEKFPQLSLTWLLTEIGPMCTENGNQGLQSINNIQSGFNSFQSSNFDSELLQLLKNKEEQIDRLIELLSKAIQQNSCSNFAPKSRQNDSNLV